MTDNIQVPSLALVLATAFHWLISAAKASCLAIKYDMARAWAYDYLTKGLELQLPPAIHRWLLSCHLRA